jgi:hypothetical protein
VQPSLLRHLRRKPPPNRLLQKRRPSLLLPNQPLPSQSLKPPRPSLLPNLLRENRLLPALQNLRLEPLLSNQPPHDLPLQEPLLPNQPWLKPLPLNQLQNQLQNRPLNQLPAPLRRNLLPSRLQNLSLRNRQPNPRPSQRQNLL